MLYGRNIKMKCGHFADTVITDVPYHDKVVDLVGCSACFDQYGTAIQPACNMDESNTYPTRETTMIDVLPKIKRDIAIPVCGALAVLTTIIILIVSI